MIRCRCCQSIDSLDRLFSIPNTPPSAQGFLLSEEEIGGEGITLIVSICINCGVVQLENSPVSYYKDVIRSTSVSNEVRNLKKSQLQILNSKYNLKSGNILEVGSGNGDILGIMNEIYPHSIGIENSADSVASCVLQGLPAIKAYPDIHHKNTFEKDYFDAFIMIMFLEHFPNPKECLEILRYWVKSDAYGLIEVPNLEMILKRCLYTEFIVDHLVYFTPDTLCRFLETNGFDVIEQDVGRDEYVITMVVKKRGIDKSFNKLPDSLGLFERSLGQLIPYCGSNRIALWGAGHQALTYLAITSLSDYVTYVIDSSPLKQGKYTPVSQIEILSPRDQRVMKEVEVIIVIAGSYTSEIVSVISKISFKKYLVYTIVNNKLSYVPS